MLSLLPLLLLPLQVIALPRYPDAWIAKAIADNHEHDCHELIYKKGCKQTRTGRLTVSVGLNAKGAVIFAAVQTNQIRRDPEVVAQCVLKALDKWKFHPPDGVEPALGLELIFADKC